MPVFPVPTVTSTPTVPFFCGFTIMPVFRSSLASSVVVSGRAVYFALSILIFWFNYRLFYFIFVFGSVWTFSMFASVMSTLFSWMLVFCQLFSLSAGLIALSRLASMLLVTSTAILQSMLLILGCRRTVSAA